VLKVWIVILWQKKIDTKAARKMFVKLIKGGTGLDLDNRKQSPLVVQPGVYFTKKISAKARTPETNVSSIFELKFLLGCANTR